MFTHYLAKMTITCVCSNDGPVQLSGIEVSSGGHYGGAGVAFLFVLSASTSPSPSRAPHPDLSV